MRTVLLIGILAATLLAKDVAKGKVRLMPKWKAGERVTVTLAEKSGYGLAKDGEEAFSAARRIEYVQTTPAAENGLPIRAKRTFSVHQVKQAFFDEPQKHSLVGQTLEFVSRDGVLHTEKAPLMMSMGAGGDWTWMLPPRAVSVGDTWTVTRGIHLLPMAFAFMAADTKCRLASVDGDTAVIKFSQSQEPNTLTGTAEFSLNAGRVLKASFKYRRDMSGFGLIITSSAKFKTTTRWGWSDAYFTTAFTYSLSILPEKK